MTRNLLCLWDYGWVDHGHFKLVNVRVPEDVPTEYLLSAEFGTSFVGPQQDDNQDIHGPFRRELLTGSDFVAISARDFENMIGQIRCPEGFALPASDEQWQPVESLVADLSARGVAFYNLRYTEVNTDLFHSWGFVLSIFREYLCVLSDMSVYRVVIGYD